MATATTTGSGLWSAAIWSGGSGVGGAPADGDAVVISAGHEVCMDADLSAWTGITTLTITGIASGSPGMLYFKDGYSGFLRFRTGTNYGILGTNHAVLGRLLGNSDGVWGTTTALPFTRKAYIQFDGTSSLMGQYLAVDFRCIEPTNSFVRVYRNKYAVSSINTGTNIITMSGAHGWSANEPVCVRSSGTLPSPLVADTIYYVGSPSGADLKLLYTSGGTEVDITSSGSGTIELYSGYSGSTYTGITEVNVLEDVSADTSWLTYGDGTSNVVLVDSGPTDYDIQRVYLTDVKSGTMTLSTALDSAQYPTARIWLSSRNISIRSTSTSTTQPILNTCHDSYFGCEIRSVSTAGLYCYGVAYSYNNTITNITGCSNGAYSSYNNTITNITGCNNGAASSYNNTITNITGCSNGAYSSYNNTITNITGCNNGAAYSYNNTITNITGCSNGAYSSYNNTITNLQNNTYDQRIYNSDNYLNHSPNTSFLWNGRNTNGGQGRLRCESLGRVEGADKIFDNFGDIIKTACDGTGDAPSVDPDGGNGNCIEASNIQQNCGYTTIAYKNKLNILESQKIWFAASSHTVTYKVQTTYAGITAGNLLLTCRYIGTDGVVTETTNAPAISQRSSAADWSQTLSVTFTSTQDGWATFSIDLMEYEAGNEVYVWPVPTGTGYDNIDVVWRDGQPELLTYDDTGAGGGGLLTHPGMTGGMNG